MAMLQQQLKIRTATFTQDNQNGTQTLLDLVVPGLLNGNPNLDASTPPPPPPPATTGPATSGGRIVVTPSDPH
jgi:hypothetical protein